MMNRTARGLLRVGVILLLAAALGGVWIWNSNGGVPVTAQDPIELEGSPSAPAGRATTGPLPERDPGSSDGAARVSNQPLPAGVTSTGDDDAAATTDGADDVPDDPDDTRDDDPVAGEDDTDDRDDDDDDDDD